jgi:hypothetical protein
MAAEILCTRWTVVLLRELVAGSTRLNDLRRGVPKMSPALPSKRLKELEAQPSLANLDPSPKGRIASRWMATWRSPRPCRAGLGKAPSRWSEKGWADSAGGLRAV